MATNTDKAVKVAVIGAAGAVLAASIPVLITTLGKDEPSKPPVAASSAPVTSLPTTTPPPATPTTDGPAIALTAEASGTRQVAVGVERKRAPRAGRSFWFVLQIHNVNGHSEFYPRKDVSASEPGYQLQVSIPPDADVARKRTGHVFEVDAATAKWMAAGAADDATMSEKQLINPPCNDCAASNEVTLPFE
ncbi:hypothetical protein JIG36_13120 [Actinoplanes sp. LDG1-06]|uniref:Uncharacterized protein n=1 Tax=Paractinoplanes ovalisporus TaxID=2810368 RepID=A0ABS2A9I9_9ACTN|nr:hypothetical protein [Actinoplanes ovalisporus]MBM2616498.1 hypothetical protein [Actinoplanes ovalisporus]